MCGDAETLDAHLYAMRQLIGLLPLLVTAVSGSGGEEFEYVGFSATIQPTTESPGVIVPHDVSLWTLTIFTKM